MPEHEDHGVAEPGADLVENGDGRAAVRALVVAVLDEAGWGAEDAQEVVLRPDGRVECGRRVRVDRRSSGKIPAWR
jgi:hypothetical protein